MLPIVSIIGRPNVGKSSLFNRIAGKKAAVVDDIAGVTRDRNYLDVSWAGTVFTLVDTGGLVPSTRDRLVGSINEQVAVAIEESAVILFLVDAGTGPTDIDMLIARKLRKQCLDRLIVVVNKAESASARFDAGAFVALGCGEPAVISAMHGQGVADLLDRVHALIAAGRGRGGPAPRHADISVAVLGRPNAGKSLFVNKLLRSERMIVDPSPGTTRDAIDSFFTYRRKTVRIIDTAGLRRKSQVKDRLEYFTNVRAIESIDRADVCALLIDAAQGIAAQDLKILGRIIDGRKGAIVCLNKWDLVEKDHRTFDTITADMRRQFKELVHIPIIAISALTGLRMCQALDTAFAVQERMRLRVSAQEFRAGLSAWTRAQPHPVPAHGDMRFLGGKQLPSVFPHFLVVCTNPRLVQPGYKRYLINKIHETFDFAGCPVDITFRPPGRPRRVSAARRQRAEE